MFWTLGWTDETILRCHFGLAMTIFSNVLPFSKVIVSCRPGPAWSKWINDYSSQSVSKNEVTYCFTQVYTILSVWTFYSSHNNIIL